MGSIIASALLISLVVTIADRAGGISGGQSGKAGAVCPPSGRRGIKCSRKVVLPASLPTHNARRQDPIWA